MKEALPDLIWSSGEAGATFKYNKYSSKCEISAVNTSSYKKVSDLDKKNAAKNSDDI
jgi:hypothetical protein